MYEAELNTLRKFEGVPLRDVTLAPHLEGLFNSQQEAYTTGVELLQVLVNSIESNSRVTPELFRDPLFKAFFQIGLNKDYLETFVEVFFDGITSYLSSGLRYNEEFVRLVKKYQRSISLSIPEYGYVNKSYSLSGLEEYKTSKSNNRVLPLSRKFSNRTVQTLFPHSRYWFPISEREGSYSPIQLNKSSKSYTPVTKNPKVFNLSYEPSVVYNNKVYIKKASVTLTEDKFIESEWNLFNPKRFNQSKSFSSTFSTLLKGVYLDVSQKAGEINSITSDSKVETYPSKYKNVLSDTELLVNSFGGAGKSIYDKLVELRIVSGFMGGHEGSSVGAVNYVSMFTEYLNFMATGQLSNSLRQQGYGKFNEIFPLSSDSLGEPQTINGLRFLEKFSNLRSFLHNTKLPGDVDMDQDAISVNPLYARYANSIEPNYSIKVYSKTEDELDFVNHSLSILLERCKYFGDKLERIENSLNKYGQLPGYESLGSLNYQIDEFQKSFPPVSYVNQVSNPGGVTGAVMYLKNGYAKLSKVLNPFSLPPSLFSETLAWMKAVLTYLENVKYELTALGIKTGGSGYLPNIENKKFVSNSSDLIKYLSSLGFKDSEISQILDVKDFPEFVAKFAPLSDSSDLNSFFRGYELSQLVYEFGGEKAIDAYLDFLYKKSSIDSLINILGLTNKDKSDATYLRISKYPKLIALLLGLTYAVDPVQLQKFYVLLGDNNVNLLESITILLQKGQDTLIKRKEDISVLDGLVSQLIRGNYKEDVFSSPDIDYEGAKENSSVSLKSWTSVIESSLGNLKNPSDLEGLYDKSVGLTLKELVTLLNNPSPTSGVAQIIDGFMGGRFAQVIRYANISGLATKLGYYKNSSQLDNKRTNFDDTYYGMPSVLDMLGGITDSLSLTIKLLESSISADWSSQYYNKPNLLDVIVSAQNKSPDSMLNLISNQYTLSKSEISQAISKSPPQEAPGIGNSRLPNRASAANSITPEQARVLSGSQVVNKIEPVVEFSAKGLIDKFIKSTERTLILNSISRPVESEEVAKSVSNVGSLVDMQRSNTITTLSPEDLSLYLSLRDQSINSNGSSMNYLANPESQYESNVLNNLPAALSSKFDPLESCRRFGGSDCKANHGDRCVGHLNKSIAPETYNLQPFNSGLVVDRPLGYFSDYLPSSGSIISNKIPSYYSLLDSPKPGRDSEPMLSGLTAAPNGKEGDMVEYSNTQFAILDFINSSKKEYTELTCASLSNTSMYQMCMNLLKCKRFKVDNIKGDSRLKFCPPGTSGGNRRKYL